jgi:hypothetical protein
VGIYKNIYINFMDMDKYKNGHYSTYLDNIPRTWTSIRMVTIALILTIYLGHGQVRMVTIALILTIYLGHGQDKCYSDHSYIVKIRAIVTILILVHVLGILSR